MIERHRAKGVKVAVVAALAWLCMAPTPGDVGGCGRAPEPLDERAYADTRRETDCTRCLECGIPTARCTRACRTDVAPELGFPPGCAPLLRDGEVCIRALRIASCTTYASYMSDTSPSAPTECQFCLPRSGSEGPSGPLLGNEAGP